MEQIERLPEPPAPVLDKSQPFVYTTWKLKLIDVGYGLLFSAIMLGIGALPPFSQFFDFVSGPALVIVGIMFIVSGRKYIALGLLYGIVGDIGWFIHILTYYNFS